MLLITVCYHSNRKVTYADTLGDLTLVHLFPDSQTTRSLVCH